MVGGGSGSLIGEVHRKADSFDREARLVAGCFSRSYDNTLFMKVGNSYQKQVDFPTFEDGTRGVKFINLCVESSQRGACWISAT
jgi:hypothetical protein